MIPMDRACWCSAGSSDPALRPTPNCVSLTRGRWPLRQDAGGQAISTTKKVDALSPRNARDLTMRKRFLSGLAVSTLVVSCWYAFGERSAAASMNTVPQTPSPAPDGPSVPPRIESDPSAAEQMLTLQHNARVDMLLYSGELGKSPWAASRLEAVALTVKAGVR